MTRPFILMIGAALLAALQPTRPDTRVSDGVVQTRWPNGVLQREATYRGGVYDGDYRSWYPSGHAFELRHYKAGHEEGTQQAWTDAGALYINYDMRGGRRYGLVNSAPCVTVRADEPALPYYDSAAFTPKWTPVDHRIAAFNMTAQTGGRVSSRDLDGKIYVASFMYTKCAAICPLVTRQLARVQQAIHTMTDVAIVSFSVTPGDDTPKVLSAFGEERGVDPSHWLLLTGDRREIYALARDSYFADDQRVSSPDEFLHTEKVLLVDREGRLRGVYNGTAPHDIDELIADISRLRSAARN